MVIFETSEGQPKYHQAATLEDAIRFVEHLRNAEDLARTKIYRLHEQPFEFKSYFKVEVNGASETSTTVDEGIENLLGAVAVTPEPEVDEPDSNGNKPARIFSRS